MTECSACSACYYNLLCVFQSFVSVVITASFSLWSDERDDRSSGAIPIQARVGATSVQS